MTILKVYVPEIDHATTTEINILRRNGVIDACADELERAHAECDTLNLLHGAARLRAMKVPLPPQSGAPGQPPSNPG